MNPSEELKEAIEKLKKTPVNKGTERDRARLKVKIAKLSEKISKKPSKHITGYSVRKQGDATVTIVGFPSVGKSTLLNALTGAKSSTAEYEFTTINVIPGVMKYNGALIQVLDVPGLIEGASKGKGFGRKVMSVLRASDLMIIMADLKNIHTIEILENELYEAGFRLNQTPPNVKITKKPEGGIKIQSTHKLSLDEKTIKEVMREYGFINCEVIFRENITLDRLIDSLSKNRVYIPGLVVVNKLDMFSASGVQNVTKTYPKAILISAKNEKNLDALREKIWEKLGLIRIYMKQIGKKPDVEKPLIVKGNATVRDVCKKIHNDFVTYFKYARVWGPSSHFEGQKVGIDHRVRDKDIVELHISKR